MPQRPLVALIALNDREAPSEADLVDYLSRQWPEEPPISQIAGKENAVSLFWGEDKVILSLSPDPIPWSDLEGPCRAAWYWPEAALSLQHHAAHLLIVLQPSSVDRIASTMKLTRVAAAATACSDAAGVFWGGGGLVHEPEPFVTTATQMNNETLPLQLWIGFRLLQNADGTCSMYTDGLEEFEQPEIEVHHSNREPQILFDRMLGVVHYVLNKGVPFKDGETFGLSDDERIAVRHGVSTCDGKTTVVILDL